MTVLLGVLAFMAILGALIIVHELGHFGAAKLFGVQVDEFGIGFPPRLKKWRRGGTLYSLNAIPLGGFVRMQGENGTAEHPAAFGAKPAWQRFVILAAGPTMNVLLAVAVFYFAFLVGSPRLLTSVTAVAPGSPAQMAGLHHGDVITAVDGQQVRYADQLIDITGQHLGHLVTLDVRRGGRVFRARLLARPVDERPANQGPLGVGVAKTTTVRYGLLGSLGRSVGSVRDMVTALPALFQSIGQHGVSQVHGPIGIAHLTTDTVRQEPQEGPGLILEFIALLSVTLGVLNLLPIPALDGGRLVFVLLSWVRRRSIDPEIEGVIHLVGMALLLVLILVVSYQDIVQWLHGRAF